MKHRLVFFGNERLATGVTTQLPILHALTTAGYEISALVINSRFEAFEFASANQIPVYSTITPETVKKLGATAAVLAAYGKLVPARLIDAFPSGIINLHPSLLPKHRGSIPIEATLLEGASETGISLMQLVPAMDAGPIYAKQTISLSGTETKQYLADQLGEIGAISLIRSLPDILNATLLAKPQDSAAATYDQRLTKADGQLNWHHSAITLERQVRAFAGWPGSYTTISGTSVTVTAAHCWNDGPLPPQAQGSFEVIAKKLIAHTGDGALVIDELKPAGSRVMPAGSFLAGHPITRSTR